MNTPVSFDQPRRGGTPSVNASARTARRRPRSVSTPWISARAACAFGRGPMEGKTGPRVPFLRGRSRGCDVARGMGKEAVHMRCRTTCWTAAENSQAPHRSSLRGLRSRHWLERDEPAEECDAALRGQVAREADWGLRALDYARMRAVQASIESVRSQLDPGGAEALLPRSTRYGAHLLTVQLDNGWRLFHGQFRGCR